MAPQPEETPDFGADARLPGSRRTRPGRRPLARGELTPRENQILEFLIEEAPSNATIAREFGLAEDTVKRHFANIMDKTGYSDRLELAIRTIQKRMDTMIEAAQEHWLKVPRQRIDDLELENSQLRSQIDLLQRSAKLSALSLRQRIPAA